MQFYNYLKQTLLLEGGNAVKLSTPMNVDNFKSTLEDIKKQIFPLFNLSDKDCKVLGSGGKKVTGTHGDIDIGISIQSFMEKNKIYTSKDIYSFIEKKLGAKSPEVVKNAGLGVISFAWPIVGEDQKDKFVQVDFMLVDSLDWAEFAYWSPSQSESKWKGLYRNILMFAIVNKMEFKELESIEDESGRRIITWQKNIWDSNKGLMKAIQTLKSEKGNIVKSKRTIEKTLLSNDPKQVVYVLLGPDASISDMNSFESLYTFITTQRSFPYKEHNNDILKFATNSLVKVGVPIPDELKKYV